MAVGRGLVMAFAGQICWMLRKRRRCPIFELSGDWSRKTRLDVVAKGRGEGYSPYEIYSAARSIQSAH